MDNSNSGQVVVVGAGGHASEVAAYLQADGWDVAAFIDLTPGDPIHGIRVTDNLDEWISMPLVHGIGDGQIRQRLQEQGGDWLTFEFGNFKGPRCKLGSGTVVCPGVVLTADVTAGRGCLLNYNATVGHGTTLGDFATILPGANVSGGVTMGDLVTVGANATILPDMSICSGVTIGAGTVVNRDITEPGTYVGVPAKRIK